MRRWPPPGRRSPAGESLARRRSPAHLVAWALVGLGSAAILVGAMSRRGGLPALEQLRGDIRRLESRRDLLRIQNAELRARIRALERDSEALEQRARHELHFVRDSELVFRTAEPRIGAPPPSPAAPAR